MNWYKESAKPKPVPLKGTLRENGGYVYLGVDSRLFAPFIRMIDDDAVVHPQEVTDDDKNVGAHVTVMKKHETEGKTIKELGKEYEFFVEGLHTVDPDGWDDVKRVYFLTVSSPDIEKLRQKYDLPKKIEDHEFHITVGVEKAASVKIASSTNHSDDGRQKGWEDTMGDIQRYTYDPYTVRVFITKLAEEKIAVSLTLHHVWSGGIIWQDFWRFDPNDMRSARKTYRAVTKAADKVFQTFRSNDIPNNLLYTYLREEVRHIDLLHKPTSRIPYVDWAREQDGVSDWRNSIYGTRYPKTEGY